MKWLTYMEKSILFSAIEREKRICIQLDNDFNSISHFHSLTSVCESLEHKFYYDRLFKQIETQIRAETINDFINSCEEIGLRKNDIEKIVKEMINKKYGVDKI